MDCHSIWEAFDLNSITLTQISKLYFHRDFINYSQENCCWLVPQRKFRGSLKIYGSLCRLLSMVHEYVGYIGVTYLIIFNFHLIRIRDNPEGYNSDLRVWLIRILVYKYWVVSPNEKTTQLNKNFFNNLSFFFSSFEVWIQLAFGGQKVRQL